MKIDSAQKDGESVQALDGGDASVDEDYNQSLGNYLEMIRDGLLSKRLIYEDELGVIVVQK